MMMISIRMLALLALIGFYIADGAAIPKDPEDEPVAASGAENSPDLLHMLNALKGESGLQAMSKFLKEFKSVREVVQGSMNASPLLKEIMESSSKQNIKLKVLMDVINGHFPDLHDLYQFMTTKTDSIVDDIRRTENTDPDYQMVLNLMDRKTDIEKQIRLFTGKNIVLKPSLINAVKAGTYKLTPENVNQVNVLELWIAIEDNYGMVRNSIANFSTGNIDYVKILKNVQGLDLSHFSKIVSPQQRMNTTKYTVTGRNQQMMQDPDVKMILRDFKTAELLTDNPNDQSKAETLLMDMYMRAARLFSKVLTNASAGASPSDLGKVTNEKSANIG